MKKSFKPIIFMFCLLAGVLLFGKAPVETQAASADYKYQLLNMRGDSCSITGPKRKIGKYYLWMEYNTDFWSVKLKAAKSKTAKGSVLATAPKNGYLSPYVVSNGKDLYYCYGDFKTHKYTLMRLTISNKKKTTIKKFPTKLTGLDPSYAYGKYVYCTQYKNSKPTVVRVDTKTKKIKTIKAGYEVSLVNGRYMYLSSSTKQLVYDCKANKFRTLIPSLDSTHRYIYKNKLYLATTKNNYNDLTKSFTTVYSFNLNGTGKKTIKKLLSTDSGQFNGKYYYYTGMSTDENGDYIYTYHRLDITTKAITNLTETQYNKYVY